MSQITISAADLCTLASDEGCNVQEQKSWYKITGLENRKAVYVAKSKRKVTKIHFAGFSLEECGVLKTLEAQEAKELKLGAVRGIIEIKDLPLDITDEDIISRFEEGLASLLSNEEGFKLGKKVAKEETAVEEEVLDVTAGVDFEGLSELSV